ncbi:hypothetical protein QYE76_020860 [Lolium multiflorum]|uniref:Uncharacterized protein n=1 Tax=Lolium multiflorum TaxID=4521 RepID=A0AAD8R9P4_LOLMU|nr:hypothetical protein QYE76_020860 [Lolium multiflorum]
MENYSLLMGDSGDEDGGGVDGEAFRGTSPSRRCAGTETPVPQILASRWRRLGRYVWDVAPPHSTAAAPHDSPEPRILELAQVAPHPVRCSSPNSGCRPRRRSSESRMSSGDEFVDVDLSDSSSSDDSNLDELLQDDEMEATMLLLSVKELEDRAKLLNRRRGSVFGRNHIQRNRLLGHEQLMEDYFAEVPTYPPHLFHRRYLMRRSLFVRIVKAGEANSNYFKQLRNAIGVMGFSAFQKISAAMRLIAYGIHADYTDEYLRIGEDTTSESVRMFARLIIKLFGSTYLRAPNEDDTKRLMEINEKTGWSGMLGSLDCLHWTWKNCPKAWHGQYYGKSKGATIVLEVVASQDLWIWHCFFGLPGTFNDINVLQRTPLFAKLANGEAPTCNYKVMNNEYTMGYCYHQILAKSGDGP